jgi:3-oxoacyl-[acyl-carrier protein] reductase
MLLQGKTAIVYGAGGHVGSQVAKVFAREGARVFLAGRTRKTLDVVAAEIGGTAEVAVVDVMDPEQVDRHAAGVAGKTGRIDVSFNGVNWDARMGRPLAEMRVEDFLTPIRNAATATFTTATAVGRHMAERGSGVILTMSTTSSRLSGRDQMFHAPGGFSEACGVVETMTRTLAGELGPRGVRVVCLRPDALPETWGPGGPDDDSPVKQYMTGATVLGRLPRIAEVAETAAFVASDRASAFTRTVMNLSCGSALD